MSVPKHTYSFKRLYFLKTKSHKSWSAEWRDLSWSSILIVVCVFTSCVTNTIRSYTTQHNRQLTTNALNIDQLPAVESKYTSWDHVISDVLRIVGNNSHRFLFRFRVTNRIWGVTGIFNLQKSVLKRERINKSGKRSWKQIFLII